MKKLTLITALLGAYSFSVEATRNQPAVDTLGANQANITEVLSPSEPNNNGNVETVRDYLANADRSNEVLTIMLDDQENQETEIINQGHRRYHWCTENWGRAANCTSGIVLCAIASAMLFGSFKIGEAAIQNCEASSERCEIIMLGAVVLFIGGVAASMGTCCCLCNTVGERDDDSADA